MSNKLQALAWLSTLFIFISGCLGGQISVADPCGPGLVLTGGWSGSWDDGDPVCIPDPDAGLPDVGEGDGGHSNGDAGDGGGDAAGDDAGTPHDSGDGDAGTDVGEDSGPDMGSCPPGHPDCRCDAECCGPECPPVCEGDDCPCVGEDCGPVCEGEEVQSHRIVGIVLQLTNPDVPSHKAKKLAQNAVRWVTRDHPCQGLEVLVVRDDDHSGEFKEDVTAVAGWLRDAGYQVTFLEEPSDGLDWSDVKHYDVVWFSNPGHPIDDVNSITTLENFVAQGGGLVMSGDDLSWGKTDAVDTEGLVHLEHHSNGTQTCGVRTDNNQGESYLVTFDSTAHPVLTGLRDLHFLYANDIDHSSPLGLGEEVLAWAELDPALQCECDVHTPVIVVKDVAPYCIEPPAVPECDGDCSHQDHPEDCPHKAECPHEREECLDDDGHPRQGNGYGHCRNADNPGHCRHGDTCDD